MFPPEQEVYLTTTYILWGILPALLVALTGVFIQYFNQERARPRLFLLAVFTLAGINWAKYLYALFFPDPYSMLTLIMHYLFQGATVGLLTLAIVFLPAVKQLNRLQKWATLMIGILGLWGYILQDRRATGLLSDILIQVGLFIIVWVLFFNSPRKTLFLGLFSLVTLININSEWIAKQTGASAPPYYLVAIALIGFYGSGILTVVASGLLLKNGLAKTEGTTDISTPLRVKKAGLIRFLSLAGCIILPTYLIYSIYWGSVWDQTDDGLLGIFLSQQAATAAIALGILLPLVLTGRRKLAGFLFGIILPILFIQAFTRGWEVDYHKLTEQRAERIAAALENYHARNGSYPKNLSQLVPRDILIIPKPVIFKGYSWCYQVGESSYRLGAAYRDNFGMPGVETRIYQSVGNPPAISWGCDSDVAILNERYTFDFSTGSENVFFSPTPEGQPTSAVVYQKELVEPIFTGGQLQTLNWSLDGRYLAFSEEIAEVNQYISEVYFLDTVNRKVCPANISLLLFPAKIPINYRTAWLSTGELIYLDDSGQLIALTPCSEKTRLLSVGVDGELRGIYSARIPTRDIILETTTGYWIFSSDGSTLNQLQGFSPSIDENSRTQFEWSPDGTRLAVSHLPPQETVYRVSILNITNREVQISLPILPNSTDFPPRLEWQTDQHILLYVANRLSILDLQSTPPQETNILKDIFQLDITYPDDVSSFVSMPAMPGSAEFFIGIRLNHPRNQAAYIYSSSSGQVQRIDAEPNLLLFFSNEKWSTLDLFQPVPDYRDVYQVEWFGQPEKSTELRIDGHTPRRYPDLFVRLLPEPGLGIFGSSQGISIVSIPDGAVLNFYELAGSTLEPTMLISPDQTLLVAAVSGFSQADPGGIYLIDLP
jgi:hypothetical protein